MTKRLELVDERIETLRERYWGISDQLSTMDEDTRVLAEAELCGIEAEMRRLIDASLALQEVA